MMTLALTKVDMPLNIETNQTLSIKINLSFEMYI